MPKAAKAHTTDKRLRGRALQARRLRVWAKDPHCTDCRALVQHPDGYELDHVVALVNGGDDTDENCAVRCHGCHERKTLKDLGHREVTEIGADGLPTDPAHPWNKTRGAVENFKPEPLETDPAPANHR